MAYRFTRSSASAPAPSWPLNYAAVGLELEEMIPDAERFAAGTCWPTV
jgi:hypothetical protein